MNKFISNMPSSSHYISKTESQPYWFLYTTLKEINTFVYSNSDYEKKNQRGFIN